MIKTAEKWVGYLEHNSNELLGYYTENVGKGYCTIFSVIIQKYYRWRNFTGLPWCAVFIHAVFLEAYGKDRARELLGKPHPGTRVLARRMKRRGWLRETNDYSPQPGDLVFLHNGDYRISHCGIVVEIKDDELISIEGNTTDPSGNFDPDQGGAVAIRIRKLTDPAILKYATTGERM